MEMLRASDVNCMQARTASSGSGWGSPEKELQDVVGDIRSLVDGISDEV